MMQHHSRHGIIAPTSHSRQCTAPTSAGVGLCRLGPRLTVRARSSAGRTARGKSEGPLPVPNRAVRVINEDRQRRVLDPKRQEKLDQYLSKWSNDVESSGPMWNPFTAILGVGALCTIMIGLFAFFSYGMLWGVTPGMQVL